MQGRLIRRWIRVINHRAATTKPAFPQDGLSESLTCCAKARSHHRWLNDCNSGEPTFDVSTAKLDLRLNLSELGQNY